MTEGDVHEWSDIDLLIIKDTSKRPIDRILEVSCLIMPKVGIDLFVYTPDEVEALMQGKYTFFSEIVAKGKVIYEK